MYMAAAVSSNVVAQPATPAAPTATVQPTCAATGSFQIRLQCVQYVYLHTKV
jgi:hypothetical protein